MNRSRPYLPQFQLRNMSGYTDENIEMASPSRHSFDNNIPTISNFEFEHQRSRSFDAGDLNERPNMIISGHRRFNKGFYTGPRNNFDIHANKIVAKLEQNEALMKDTPVSEQLRKEALRDLPQCLTMKRCVKKKLTKSVSMKSKRKPIGWWKRLKYTTSVSLSRFGSSVKNFNYFELWHNSLKDIEGHFGSGYASYFKFLRWSVVMNAIVAITSFCMIVIPQILYDASLSNYNHTFQFKDIFTGNGFFNETVFYYGHYVNFQINVIPHLFYNMPAAYFATTVFLYLISLIVLGISVAESYRRTFIETEGGLQNVYANRVFCGWDYGIATREAAQLKSSAIYNELKELLNEESDDVEERTCLYKFWTYIIQVIVNILILVMMAAVGYSVWLILRISYERGDDTFVVVPILVNVIMMIFPPVLSYISEYEDYKNPRTAVYITLTRTFILGAIIIGTVVSYWLTQADIINCWENYLGAEIYRLILFDFLFSVVLTAIIDVGYYFGRYFSGYDPKSEFDISRHTLLIIYNQGLFWVGFIYSPVLPLLVTLKMFVIWYIRKGYVQKCCKPLQKTWRAAQAQTWFMMMIFFSILLVIAMHGYTLTSIPVSQNCGPFSNNNYTFAYQIVTNGIGNLEESSNFWKIIMNVTKPGGIALIMIALVVIIYNVREQAIANQEKVRMLRDMLVWMAKDKKFLVQWYDHVTKGQSDTNFHETGFLDPSQILPHEYTDCSSSIDEDELNARFRKHC